MERNIQSGKALAKKASAISKPVETDPFADSVEETPVKKAVKKKVTATVTPEVKPVKKVVRKTAKTDVLDPFAEIAEATPPVKKRATRSVKAKAETPTSAVKKVTKKTKPDVLPAIAIDKAEVELSPLFKKLADPVLPELPRENRARLQMQTPTRLYFYWSIRENPYHLLRNAFGDDLGSYTLVLKLIDKKFGYEEIHQADAEGNYWFNVEPDRKYQAEIGFYAPNRPYFRIIYSNIVETPRRSPSPHSAAEAKWTVSANKFAEVLDVAGFTQDAFDVSMAGDDQTAAETITYEAFTRFVGPGDFELKGIAADEIRYALIALASGLKLEELRWKISPALFAILQTNADEIQASKAMGILTEYFDIDEAEFTEEQFGSAVYGASLVNFPRTLKTRAMSPKFASLSSHSYR